MAVIPAGFSVVVAAVRIKTATVRVDDRKCGANEGDSNHEPEKRAAKRHRMGELYRYAGARVKDGRALAVAP